MRETPEQKIFMRVCQEGVRDAATVSGFVSPCVRNFMVEDYHVRDGSSVTGLQ